MKREGRQHGLVRSFRIVPEPLNPRPETRFVNKFDSPPTAGLFTKVSSKPTNHSKFTGKCGSPRCSSCHLHPACKSKHKVKGTHKHKSSDAASNYRLVTFRVVDERPGLHAFGFSASGLLDHMYDEEYYSEDEKEDEGYELYEGGNEDNYSFGELLGGHDDEVEVRNLPWNAYDEDENGNWRCGDDANVCISEMGFEIDRAEVDEGWCLVESSS